MENYRKIKRTFNAVASTLVSQMLTLFPGDPTFTQIKDALQVLMSDRATDSKAMDKWFQTMNTNTGNGMVIGEFVMRRDESLFTLEVVDGIISGMSTKWPRLSQENKEMVWQYLERMAKLSAQGTIAKAVKPEDVQNMLNQLSAD